MIFKMLKDGSTYKKMKVLTKVNLAKRIELINRVWKV